MIRILLLLVVFILVNTISAQEASIAPGHMFSITEGLRSPVRIAIDNQDIVYVTDAFQKCIAKYNLSGDFLGTISPGSSPISIAINNENQIFVGDGESGAILELDNNGSATEFCRETEFPSSMVFSPENLLYVVDSKMKKVLVIDLSGNVVQTIGEGTLVLPTGIAYDHKNEKIHVSEHGGIGTGFSPVAKIWTFDLHGNLLQNLGSHGNGEGQFYRIQGLTVGRCGKIFATDPFQGTVSVFDDAGYVIKFGEYGEELGKLNAPMDIVVDSRGFIWVTSMNNGSLEVYNDNETKPTSNISQAISSICTGETIDIPIDFTGSAPWTFTYTVDGINPTTINETNDNPYILKVSDPGIYEVTALSDAEDISTCITGSANVSIKPLSVPEFTYSEDQLAVSFLNNSTNADSYIWDFGDNETSREVHPIHVYTKAGSYNVVLTASYEGCGEITVNQTLSIIGSSVESAEQEIFVNIYPNPSNGEITVAISNPVPSDIKIEITNVNGQRIYSNVIESQKVLETIDLSYLPEGLYILTTISDNFIKTDKIILNKTHF